MDTGWDTPCDLAACAPRTGEQAILSRYLPLVKRAAAHLRSQVSASFDREDMEQVGMMGLLEAMCAKSPADTVDALFSVAQAKRKTTTD